MNPRHVIIRLLYCTSILWPDKLYLQLLYYFYMGQRLNLKRPKTFTEKLQWLKLYNRRPEYTAMVDKYAVKQYVADRIGNKYIIPTIGVWDNVEDIDWEALPNQFVLKTTHGGGNGGVYICRDKAHLKKEEAINKLQRSMNQSIYNILREWPYKDVTKRVIAEKFMVESNIQNVNKDLTDYKFFCFNGKPTYCQVIRDRNTIETVDFYDMQWKHMPFVGLNPKVNNGVTLVSKPNCLEKMIEISKTLSKDIPFARIDLYEINNEIYFGEITFYPRSGIGEFSPSDWNDKLGEMIKLPTK